MIVIINVIVCSFVVVAGLDVSCLETGFEVTALTRRGGNAEGIRTFTLRAESDQLCVEWMQNICHCVGTLELVPDQMTATGNAVMEGGDHTTIGTSETPSVILPTSTTDERCASETAPATVSNSFHFTAKHGINIRYTSQMNFNAVKRRDKARLQANLFRSPNNGMSDIGRKSMKTRKASGE